MCCQKKQKQEEKKEEKVKKCNGQKKFYKRKYCIAEPKIYGLRLVLAIAYLIWNIISFNQYKTQKDNPDSLRHSPELYNAVTFDSSVFISYNLKDIQCKTCQAADDYFAKTYKKDVQSLFQAQDNYLKAQSGNQGILLFDQVISIGVALSFAHLFGTKISQMYVSFFSLMTTLNMHSPEISRHMLKHSNGKCNECGKKYVYCWVNFLKTIAPWLTFISYVVFAITYSVSCLSNTHLDSESHEFLQLLQAVLDETKKSQEFLFGYNLIGAVNYYNDSLTNCSTTGIMKYIFSNAFNAISFIQTIIGAILAFKGIYDCTCGSSRYFSHHFIPTDDAEYLIAFPYDKEELRIKLTEEERKKHQDNKDNEKAKQQHQPNHTSAINFNGANQSQFQAQQTQQTQQNLQQTNLSTQQKQQLQMSNPQVKYQKPQQIPLQQSNGVLPVSNGYQQQQYSTQPYQQIQIYPSQIQMQQYQQYPPQMQQQQLYAMPQYQQQPNQQYYQQQYPVAQYYNNQYKS